MYMIVYDDFDDDIMLCIVVWFFEFWVFGLIVDSFDWIVVWIVLLVVFVVFLLEDDWVIICDNCLYGYFMQLLLYVMVVIILDVFEVCDYVFFFFVYWNDGMIVQLLLGVCGLVWEVWYGRGGFMLLKFCGVISVDVVCVVGVFQMMVLCIVNGCQGVLEYVRVKVEVVIQQFDYCFNFSVCSFVISCIQMIGVVFGDLCNSYYVELLYMISDDFNCVGYCVFIFSGCVDIMEDFVRILWEINVDGVILIMMLFLFDDEGCIVFFGVFVVIMGFGVVIVNDLILFDNVDGGWIVGCYLIFFGYWCIGVIVGFFWMMLVCDCYEGFFVEFEVVGVLFDFSFFDVVDFDYVCVFDVVMCLF